MTMTDREAEVARIIEEILVNIKASQRWPDKWQSDFTMNIMKARLEKAQEILRSGRGDA